MLYNNYTRKILGWVGPARRIMKSTFNAEITKITTLVSGGWRLHLDIPESCSDQLPTLSKMMRKSLGIGIVTEDETLPSHTKTTELDPT